MESTGITQQILQVHLWTTPTMLLIRQTGGSREPWGHSSWCLCSSAIKMYVFYSDASSIFVSHLRTSRFQKGAKPLQRLWQWHKVQDDTRVKRGDLGLGQDGTVLFAYHFVPCKPLLCLMWKGNIRRVWFCVTLHREKGQKTAVTLVKDNRPINHLHHDSLSLCLAHTGDTANVLLRFLCGVSILAQGSDLRGHGVLVMPPRLTVPVCPQSVCKQIKRRGLFN